MLYISSFLKRTNMVEENIDTLKKENEGMKNELEEIYRNRKFNNFIGSTFFAVFMAILFGILMMICDLGVHSMIKEYSLEIVWISILTSFVALAKFIGYFYIFWHWFVVTCYTFEQDFNELGKKLKIYIRAGRKALAEAKTTPSTPPPPPPTS